MAAVTEGFDDRLREVEMHNQRNTDRISSHEDICAVRYQNINETLAGIKSILFWVGGAILAGMAAILVHQVFP